MAETPPVASAADEQMITRILESITDAFFALDRDWRFTYANQQAGVLLERDRDELLGRNVWEEFPEAVGSVFHDEYHRAAREQTPAQFEAYYPPLGRWFGVRAFPSPEGLAVYFGDISRRKRTEALVNGQKRALESAVHGAPLAEVLDVIARTVEEQSAPGVLASILLLDGTTLRHGAAPSLPDPYNRAIDGIAIGPSVGSCGTAAYLAREVIVSEIATDPLWAEFKDLAAAHGLRACWSTPILSSRGEVLGTFALYNRAVHAPSPEDREVVDFLAHTAAIVIERYRVEVESREARLRAETLARLHEAQKQELAEAHRELRRRHDQVEQEVTERTRELAREREFLRTLLDSLSEGIVACDAEGTPTLFNRASLGFHGLPAGTPPSGWDRHPDLYLADGVTPLSREETPLTRALRGEIVRDAEIVIRPDGGPERRVLVNGRALHDPEGNNLGAVVAQIDITERKRAEEALRGMAESMSAATGDRFFDSLSAYLAKTMGVDYVLIGELVGERKDAVRTVSLLVKGEIASPMEYRLAGTPCENVVGRSMCTYLGGVQALFPDDRELVDLGVESYIGTPLFDSEGQPMGLIVLMHSGALENAEHAEMLLRIVAKRTEAELERKRALEEVVRRAEELERANERLKEVDRLKDDFLAALSVQLASPVNAIRAAADVLTSGGAGALARDQSELASRITAQSAVMLTLVGDLLDLGRMSAGRFRLELHETDLDALVRGVAATLAPIAEQQGLRIIYDIAPSLPRVLADEARLEQVLVDYYHNAIRLTPAGGLVRLGAREDGVAVRFEIFQSGPALAGDEARKIFDGFTQVGGTWLGLSVARQIVEAHSGTVGAEPGDSDGNAFWFAVPKA